MVVIVSVVRNTHVGCTSKNKEKIFAPLTDKDTKDTYISGLSLDLWGKHIAEYFAQCTTFSPNTLQFRECGSFPRGKLINSLNWETLQDDTYSETALSASHTDG